VLALAVVLVLAVALAVLAAVVQKHFRGFALLLVEPFLVLE
jgi:hypothetical protein